MSLSICSAPTSTRGSTGAGGAAGQDESFTTGRREVDEDDEDSRIDEMAEPSSELLLTRPSSSNAVDETWTLCGTPALASILPPNLAFR